MDYVERLNKRIQETGSSLCVGIDPRPEQIEGDLTGFLLQLIDETELLAAAYKPNMAYFESLGSKGVVVLEKVLERLVGRVPVVLDCKRGDIGATQEYYAKAYFESWNVDAVTLSPYMGFDSVEPFLRYEGKGAYLLGVTSNAGAADIELQRTEDGRYVFELVQDLVRRAGEEDLPGTAGLVVGLTNMSEEVLGRIDDVPILAPGLGAQGGDVRALGGTARSAPILVNVSRGIMFGDEKKSFGEKAKEYADRIAADTGRDD